MFEAAIFDMDGLLIDSEPFWREAEKEVFGALGIHVTEDLALHTSRMTTAEVTAFWYNNKPWSHKSLAEVEQGVIEKVGQLIETNGMMMPGVLETLEFFKTRNYKIGLATNAPYSLISIVLQKLDIGKYFNALSSADFEEKGKPDPGVYLATAKKLRVNPSSCIAFEDSPSGLTAALRAGMTAIAVPYQPQPNGTGFEIADLKLTGLNEFSDEHIEQLLLKKAY